jgi:hypothetical protein
LNGFTDSFNKQLRAIAAEDGEESVLFRLLKRDLKSKLATVKRDRSFDIPNNEER